MKKAITALLLAVLCFSLSACGNRYRVDYEGSKSAFRGARDSYPAGSTVRLRFDCIATDTDYTFYVDGKTVSPSYEDGCFIITFTMPAHDITVSFSSVNSMAFIWEMTPSRCLFLAYDGNEAEYTAPEGIVSLRAEMLGEDGPLCLRLTLTNNTEESFVPGNSFTLEKQTDGAFVPLPLLSEQEPAEAPAELLPGETASLVCNLSCFGDADSFTQGIYRLTLADITAEFEIVEYWTE